MEEGQSAPGPTEEPGSEGWVGPLGRGACIFQRIARDGSQTAQDSLFPHLTQGSPADHASAVLDLTSQQPASSLLGP